MSLKPQPIGQVPELTAYVAGTAFPNGNPYVSLRDALGTFYDDERFALLFPGRGRPAEAPWDDVPRSVEGWSGDASRN
jgi:transposase